LSLEAVASHHPTVELENHGFIHFDDLSQLWLFGKSRSCYSLNFHREKIGEKRWFSLIFEVRLRQMTNKNV